MNEWMNWFIYLFIGPRVFVQYAEDVDDIFQHHRVHHHQFCSLTTCRVTEADDLTFPQSLGLKAVSSTSTPVSAPNVYSSTPTRQTELLWFGPASQPCRLPSQSNGINVNQCIVKAVTVVRDLGVWFDAELSMRSHVSQTCFIMAYEQKSLKSECSSPTDFFRIFRTFVCKISGNTVRYAKVTNPKRERGTRRFWTDIRSWRLSRNIQRKKSVNTIRSHYALSNELKMIIVPLPLSLQRVTRKRKTAVLRAKSHFAWRKSATKFLCVKTVSDKAKVVRHLLAYLSVQNTATEVLRACKLRARRAQERVCWVSTTRPVYNFLLLVWTWYTKRYYSPNKKWADFCSQLTRQSLTIFKAILWPAAPATHNQLLACWKDFFTFAARPLPTCELRMHQNDHNSVFCIINMKTRKRVNCECIATWGRPSHASPFPL